MLSLFIYQITLLLYTILRNHGNVLNSALKNSLTFNFKYKKASRREKKEFAEKEGNRTNKKLLENMMRKHAIKEVLGENAPSTSADIPRKRTAEDVFQLPPLPEEFKKLVIQNFHL